jgi:hypothetical protein
VGERLGDMDLATEQREETLRELAGHLEDIYQEGRTRGLSESDALEGVLDEVTDWDELGQKIRCAKGWEDNMNSRTRSFWLPGLASLTVSMAWLMVLQRAGVKPHVTWLGWGMALTQYLPWLVAQPLFGGLGAYLSRRAGGESLTRILAGLFPAIATLGLFCVVLPVGLFIEKNGFILRHPLVVVLSMGVWIVPPSVGLLLGALPFAKGPGQLNPGSCDV